MRLSPFLLATSVALTLVTVITTEGSAQPRESRCAECHRSSLVAPRFDHLLDWEQSPHGREGVSCDACHGGNAVTLESPLAHQQILNSQNPSSPVHRTNLAETCGTCHEGPFAAFQESWHFELLNMGNRDAPTCTTCHGTVAAQLLSPKGLERQCGSCHGADGLAPRAGRPRAARIMLERIVEVRRSLDGVARLVRLVEDPVRRLSLLEAYQVAELPLTQSTHAVHQFVFDDQEDRLAEARRRVQQLLRRLVNPE